MNARDFCFWLQGHFEGLKAKSLDEEQTETVKRHLALVFQHDIDPTMGDKNHQENLNKTHHGKGPGSILFRC